MEIFPSVWIAEGYSPWCYKLNTCQYYRIESTCKSRDNKTKPPLHHYKECVLDVDYNSLLQV